MASSELLYELSDLFLLEGPRQRRHKIIPKSELCLDLSQYSLVQR